MTPAQLRVLVAVADHSSFSRAAAELGQTQPYVSRTIRALEDAFGAPLFVRAATGVALTELGREALRRARSALRELDGLRQIAVESGTHLRGTLKVGAPPSLANWPLPKILGPLRRRYPDLAIRTFEGDPPELRTWLEDGVLDVALATRPVAGWTWTALVEEEFVVVGPWPESARSMAIPMTEIATEPLVLSSCGIERVLGEDFAREGLSLRVAHRSRSYSTIFAMVEEGLGLTILPKSIALFAPAQLSERPIANGPTRTIGVLSPAAPSRPISAFMMQAEGITTRHRDEL
ncbi:MAG TPA: LysR family transcriptional regulator [Aliidongia sp.]|nr:LysR family transcriptional regulator [Aliidongia sp.]